MLFLRLHEESTRVAFEVRLVVVDLVVGVSVELLSLVFENECDIWNGFLHNQSLLNFGLLLMFKPKDPKEHQEGQDSDHKVGIDGQQKPRQ